MFFRKKSLNYSSEKNFFKYSSGKNSLKYSSGNNSLKYSSGDNSFSSENNSLKYSSGDNSLKCSSRNHFWATAPAAAIPELDLKLKHFLIYSCIVIEPFNGILFPGLFNWFT